MIYSIYNYDTHAYDYYEGNGPGGTHAGTPPIRRPKSELGASPEQAAWVLPAGARKVGSGELPQGVVASLSGEEADDGAVIVRIGVVGVALFFAWRFLR